MKILLADLITGPPRRPQWRRFGEQSVIDVALSMNNRTG